MTALRGTSQTEPNQSHDATGRLKVDVRLRTLVMDIFADYTPSRRADRQSLEKLVVRVARLGDAEPIGRIIVDRQGGMVDARVEQVTSEIQGSQSGGDVMLCVAETQGKTIGFGRWGLFDPEQTDEACSAPGGWYMMGMIVAPEFRRYGVGMELIRFRMKWIAERADEAYYFASARNRASIDLHAKFGFVERERNFTFPKVTFTGGVGILFRAELTGAAIAGSLQD